MGAVAQVLEIPFMVGFEGTSWKERENKGVRQLLLKPVLCLSNMKGKILRPFHKETLKAVIGRGLFFRGCYCISVSLLRFLFLEVAVMGCGENKPPEVAKPEGECEPASWDIKTR